METTRKSILKMVKNLRESKDLSQESIADMMKITQSAYARFESGRTKTDLETLESFCSEMNISLIDLFVSTENKTKNESEVKAQIVIELRADKKDQVLKMLFGTDNLEILKK
jgi:transcriptional regulator with XRE-family HTH domain